MIDKLGGLPIIIKTIHGSQGNGVSIVNDAMSAKSVLQTLHANSVRYIIQEYIDYEHDIRAIVVGEHVIAAMERTRIKKDFRANMSMGAEGKPITLSKADEYLCVQAAKVVNLDVCGVDLLKTKKKTYINEVNGNFGFKIQKVTRINIASLIVEYAVKQVENRKVHPQQKVDYSSIKLLQAEIDSLRKRNEFYETSYIAQLTEKHKGKVCTFIDRDNNTKRLKINNVRDMMEVISNTVNLY
jgi:biotin carboxylase